ncbi:hypothetical protein MY4824_005337 [Beauveria thailandica]
MAPTVLVTGASGFLATHVVATFLAKGYNVRGTVRSAKAASAVRNSHPQFKDQLSTVVVPDIAVPDAFDAAVHDVDGIIHTASPFFADAVDYENQLFKPAVQGTTSVLDAALKHGPSVSRIVITSSFAAVVDPLQGMRPGYSYTEADWNPVTKDMAMGGDGGLAYLASKTMAEKAAWDFVKENKPKFSVATICPPMIYGPIAHGVDQPQSLNTSSKDIFRLIDGSEKTVPETGIWAFADVRDVAEAHLRAFESPEAGGERFLIASSAYSYQQICDIIRAKFPELRDSTPEGAVGQELPQVYSLDTSKARNSLKMTFRPLRITIEDTVEGLLELQQQKQK